MSSNVKQLAAARKTETRTRTCYLLTFSMLAGFLNIAYVDLRNVLGKYISLRDPCASTPATIETSVKTANAHLPHAPWYVRMCCMVLLQQPSFACFSHA